MTKKEIKILAKVASESFLNDVVYSSPVKNEKVRKKFIYHLMRFRLNASLNSGDVIVADEDLKGVCVWRKSEASFTFKDFVSCPSTLPLLTRYLPYLIKVLSSSSAIDVKVFGENALLIEPVFVSPDCQGKGVAKRLILEKAPELTEKGFTLGLITQNENNIPIYEKIGFKKTGENRDEKSGIIHRYMVFEN